MMDQSFVTFSTTCWEKDWRLLLEHPTYLKDLLIGNHNFPFSEKLLIINNVKNLPQVIQAAQKKVDDGTLTRYLIADEIASAAFSFFHLKRDDFPSDWLYYNALGPLSAIFAAKGSHLLYHTGDVRLNKKVSWIPQALALFAKHPQVKVANLTWNCNYKEAKKESYRSTLRFFWSKQGFSDQQFLIPLADFKQPIYSEIRSEGAHYPRGDVFEKRVFSTMLNRGWERVTYRWGSYIHENV